MNRPVRDPYAGWCERRTSSEKSGEAVYSITCWRSVVRVLKHFIVKGFKSVILYVRVCVSSVFYFQKGRKFF